MASDDDSENYEGDSDIEAFATIGTPKKLAALSHEILGAEEGRVFLTLALSYAAMNMRATPEMACWLAGEINGFLNGLKVKIEQQMSGENN